MKYTVMLTETSPDEPEGSRKSLLTQICSFPGVVERVIYKLSSVIFLSLFCCCRLFLLHVKRTLHKAELCHHSASYRCVFGLDEQFAVFLTYKLRRCRLSGSLYLCRMHMCSIYEHFLFLAPCVVCLHYVKRCIPTVSLYTDVLTIKLRVLNAWRRTQSVQPAAVRWS